MRRPWAEIVHFEVQAAWRKRKSPCGLERMSPRDSDESAALHVPKEYTDAWKYTTCPKCHVARKERRIKDLREQQETARRAIERAKKRIQELEDRIEEETWVPLPSIKKS